MTERETWANKIEAFLSVLGYIIGLGNIWRFPYMAFKNGGGAFLIPYSICALLIGFPLFFMETALGQFMKRGGIGSWNIAPLLKGVGLGTFLIAVYCNIYYIVVMAWAILYFFITISHGTLPWTTCDNWWNSDNCQSYNGEQPFLDANETMFYANETTPVMTLEDGNSTSGNQSTLSVLEFWNNFVLRKTSGFEDMGTLENWPLILSYIGGWILCYFCTFKGVKSTGKVVYFTATFPYFVLLVLLVKGCTLPGALDGVKYYLEPNVSRLADPQVWVDAASQIVYSYGICFSTLITFASFNDFNHDCFKHALKLVVSCSLTSFVNGFAIFTVIGNLAYVQNITVTDLRLSGPGLVFIAFPTALSLMPAPNLWNALFFFMIILLGIDSQFSCMEAVSTVIVDAYPEKFVKKYRRELLVGLLTLAYIIIGIPFMLNGGIFVFELFNNYAVGGTTMLFLTVVEAIAIGHVYGADRFVEDIKLMIGYRVPSVFKFAVMYVSPLLTSSICLYYFIKYSPPKVDDYVFPPAAQVVGWILMMSSFLCVPIFAIYKLATAKGTTFMEKVRETRQPIYSPHILEIREKREKGIDMNGTAKAKEMEVFIPDGRTDAFFSAQNGELPRYNGHGPLTNGKFDYKDDKSETEVLIPNGHCGNGSLPRKGGKIDYNQENLKEDEANAKESEALLPNVLYGPDIHNVDDARSPEYEPPLNGQIFPVECSSDDAV